MKPIIYLDMDGVCVDFTSAGIRANGKLPDVVLKRWEEEFPGEFYPNKALEVTMREFWKAIAVVGESFWIDLEEYEWYNQLLTELQARAKVIFLSTATYNPTCLSGKLKWLQKRFGEEFQDYIFTAHKYCLASSSTILIDDYYKNINEFRGSGGTAVLFPQIWNTNHHIEDKIKFTLEKVDEFLKNLSG